jgi:hypothetical protein
MENIRDMIVLYENELNIKLMVPPYRYDDEIHKNMEINKNCMICKRTIGIFEAVLKEETGEFVCQQCHYEHIAGVNVATYTWFKKLNIELREDLDMSWVTHKMSDLIEFTFWLDNHPRLKNEYYVALEKPDENDVPRIMGYYLPQYLETMALNIWLTEIGINTHDCTFRTLDSFPNFRNIYEDVIVIYNNPDKTHSNRDGKPLNMKVNPISELLGENIKGTITFINKDLLTHDALDKSYALRAPKIMSSNLK